MYIAATLLSLMHCDNIGIMLQCLRRALRHQNNQITSHFLTSTKTGPNYVYATYNNNAMKIKRKKSNILRSLA